MNELRDHALTFSILHGFPNTVFTLLYRKKSNVLFIFINSYENFKLIELNPQLNLVDSYRTHWYSESSISYQEVCFNFWPMEIFSKDWSVLTCLTRFGGTTEDKDCNYWKKESWSGIFHHLFFLLDVYVQNRWHLQILRSNSRSCGRWGLDQIHLLDEFRKYIYNLCLNSHLNFWFKVLHNFLC